MRQRLGRTAIAMLAMLATAAGCQPVLPTKGKSPLAPAPMSHDSCVLEVFFIRLPFGDPQANQTLWQEIDEQHFAPQLRGRLGRNGFRAGLVSGPIPVALAQLLELSEKPPPTSEMEESPPADLSTKPRVMRRHIQARAGQRSEIVASGIYKQLPVLVWESGRLGGETYEQAQGVLAVKTSPQADGLVQVDLIPELHYGQIRKRWVPDQGMMRLEAGRPRRVFKDLTLTATLSPGSILVLTSLPNRSGSLGHQFFTEQDGRLEQKLLLIRLAQTQHDDLFAPTDVPARKTN